MENVLTEDLKLKIIKLLFSINDVSSKMHSVFWKQR